MSEPGRLWQAWEVLMGRADIYDLTSRIDYLLYSVEQYKQQVRRLEDDNRLARVGVRDLQAKFDQLGGEAKIKAASDAVGSAICASNLYNTRGACPTCGKFF